MDEFATDCRLVIENTKTFYGGREDGRIFIDQAEELNRVLTQQLDAFNRYLSSSAGLQLKAKAAAKVSPTAPPLFPKPPVAALMGVLEDMRGLSYTDKATKVCVCYIVGSVLYFCSTVWRLIENTYIFYHSICALRADHRTSHGTI